MPRLARSTVLTGLLVAGAVVLCGCGSEGASGSGTAQERAQAGLLSSYTATYQLLSASSAGTATSSAASTATVAPVKAGTMTVQRTPSSLRLDITTSTGTSSSITTPRGTVACQRPSSGKPATCLTVAGPGKTPPATFDPVLRKAFGDVLRTLAADPDGLTVEPGGTSSAAGVECQEFAVTASPQGKVPAGTYCLSADGVPVRLAFPSGDAVLTELTRATPSAPAFTPPARPTPLPTTGR